MTGLLVMAAVVSATFAAVAYGVFRAEAALNAAADQIEEESP